MLDINISTVFYTDVLRLKFNSLKIIFIMSMCNNYVGIVITERRERPKNRGAIVARSRRIFLFSKHSRPTLVLTQTRTVDSSCDIFLVIMHVATDFTLQYDCLLSFVIISLIYHRATSLQNYAQYS